MIHKSVSETPLPPFKIHAPKKEELFGNFVGMPAALHLEEFGSQVWSAFGSPPYLVGSAITSKTWRDVDVRLILMDDEYEALFPKTDPRYQSIVLKWTSLCMAYAALGRQMTGLPIDFQIQQATEANKMYRGPRFAIGVQLGLRMAKPVTFDGVLADIKGLQPLGVEALESLEAFTKEMREEVIPSLVEKRKSNE